MAFALEAICSEDSLLKFPCLHIYVEKVKGPDNQDVYRGRCLDLGITAYSGKEKRKDIKIEIFNAIVEMAISQMLAYLDKGIEDRLFISHPSGKSDWGKFNQAMAKTRIRKLKKSYDNLVKDTAVAIETHRQKMSKQQIEFLLSSELDRIEKLRKLLSEIHCYQMVV